MALSPDLDEFEDSPSEVSDVNVLPPVDQLYDIPELSDEHLLDMINVATDPSTPEPEGDLVPDAGSGDSSDSDYDFAIDDDPTAADLSEDDDLGLDENGDFGDGFGDGFGGHSDPIVNDDLGQDDFGHNDLGGI